MKTSMLIALAAMSGVAGWLSGPLPAAHAAPGATNPARAWQYTLLPDSQLVDDCLFCGRPTLFVRLQGMFQLRFVEENPLFSTYAWEFISWVADNGGGLTDKVTGQGTYTIGGEVALRQDLRLAVNIDTGWTNKLCSFTNTASAVERPWPNIKISLDQTNGTPGQQFHLDIVAAPMREIWFSTRNGFHAGIWNAPSNYLSPGDLISSAGRIIRRNGELTRNLGIMPTVPDLGLDAVDVLPGGEIAFSTTEDAFSESLGSTLHNGDILSDRGRVLRRYAQLIGAFGPQPPVADQGLDALQVLSNGEIWFSVTNDFFSETLGRLIGRGDLLSSTGAVVKSNAALVAAFKPAGTAKDYGLDAIHVWPNGEVWFSVEEGFSGQHFEPYAPGDILSDQGYVVYRNLDLLRVFQPLEDLSDFGLDALFIVSDADIPPALPGGRLMPIDVTSHSGSPTLRWEGQGRLWQIQKTADVFGPWSSVTPISTVATNLEFIDAGALTNQPQGFYRLLQW